MNKTTKSILIASGITLEALLGMNLNSNAAEIIRNGDRLSIKAERADSYVVKSVESEEDRAKANGFSRWLSSKILDYNSVEKSKPINDYFAQNGEFNSLAKQRPVHVSWDMDKGYITINSGDYLKTFDGLEFKPAERQTVVVDRSVFAEDETANKEINKKVIVKSEKELKAEKKKAESEAKLKKENDEKRAGTEQEIKYIIENDNAKRNKYIIESFDTAFAKGLEGMLMKDISIAPEIGVFETFDADGKKAYILDLDNYINDSAVYMELDSTGAVKSRNLLLEKDLGEKVSQYLKNSRLVTQDAGKVMKNLNQLKRRNALVVKHFDKEYVFVKRDEEGIAYPLNGDAIFDIKELDKQTLNRALERKENIELGIGDEISLSYLFSGTGVVPGWRGKANIIYNNSQGIIKQAQAVLSNTNKFNEKFSGGMAYFQGINKNWRFGEIDAFFRYLGKNTRIDFLTGMSIDNEDFGKTAVANYILEQSRDGKSGLLLNIEGEFKSPVQIPGIWEKANIGIAPFIIPAIAYVDGNDTYKYAWLNQDESMLSIPGFQNPGFMTIPSNYTTASLDAGLNIRVEPRNIIDINVLVGAGYNKFSQLSKGQMNDNANNLSRAGIFGGYNTNNIKTNALILCQSNTNKGKSGLNDAVGANLQAGYRYKDYAGLINLVSEGYNGSNMANISLMKSRYADKYLEHETDLNKRQAMYDLRNTNSLLPTGTSNKAWDTPPIYEGTSLSIGAGKTKFGEDLCNAALKLYLGKNWGASLSYDKKADKDNYNLKFNRTF